MNPCCFPRAQTRVPKRYIPTGMTRAEEEAINPKVTIPFVKACPEEPRIANAVMLVPNRERRKTIWPSERPARKKSSAGCSGRARRKAKIPM